MAMISMKQIDAQLREIGLEKRIIEFMRHKKRAGKEVNTREIATALSVRRYDIVMKMPLLIITKKIEMTGHTRSSDGAYLMNYTVSKTH